MRVCRSERHSYELAVDAARAAIAKRGIAPTDIDVLVLCSCGRQDEARVLRLGADIGHPKAPLLRVLGGCDVMLQAIELATSWLSWAGGK
jgi:3-oxoacyl-[acyl-carrier-protein] synthase III